MNVFSASHQFDVTKYSSDFSVHRVVFSQNFIHLLQFFKQCLKGVAWDGCVCVGGGGG